jgi:hypothetical protein
MTINRLVVPSAIRPISMDAVMRQAREDRALAMRKLLTDVAAFFRRLTARTATPALSQSRA